jgi:hypothetical protein
LRNWTPCGEKTRKNNKKSQKKLQKFTKIAKKLLIFLYEDGIIKNEDVMQITQNKRKVFES